MLDLGVGIGRHSIYLTDKGFIVSALDGSYSGLCTIRDESKQRGLPIFL